MSRLDSGASQLLFEDLLTEIPIARSLEPKLQNLNEEKIEVTASHQASRNHLGTVFGGSLHSLALLAAYSLIFSRFKLSSIDADLSLRRSESRFLIPVQKDFKAVATWSLSEQSAAWKTLKSRSMVGIAVEVELWVECMVVARVQTEFVAKKGERLGSPPRSVKTT